MPLTGGPADKLGNRYERSWTVSRIVDILLGDGDGLRIEDPTAEKSEFVVSANEREFHQAKRAHGTGVWSFSSLGEDLLRAMYTQLVGNDAKFVFVSGSDAPDLRELAERARSALDFVDFDRNFSASKSARDGFNTLRGRWGNPPSESAFDVLRRIHVRVQDEQSIRDSIELGLRVLFLSDPAPIASALSGLIDDSLHVQLTRQAVVDFLQKKGYKARALIAPASASALIGQTTDAFRVGISRRLIQGKAIPRVQTKTLLEHVLQDPVGGELVVTGRAGSGKSVVIYELAEALRNQGVPTLAFRLDRLRPTADPTDLGRQLGLEESPAVVLASSSKGLGAVLIIDQLDAVSTTSGRTTGFLDGISSLLNDVRILRKQHRLHVVLACRAFDWHNDQRLREILLSSHTQIEIGVLSLEEVHVVLTEAGVDGTTLGKGQLELLQLPQNLSLFLEGNAGNRGAPPFRTVADLSARYWETKRQAVQDRAGADHWASAIRLLTDEMTDTQQLFVGQEKLDAIDASYLAHMSSEGVLTFDGKRYGFGHESFFDYCFARTFVTRARALIDMLKESEQHLFRRAQVRQVLAYLRDADRARYLRELVDLIRDEGIRAHIRDLAIAWLMGLDDPSDEEWALAYPHIRTALTAFDPDSGADKVSTMIFRRFWTSSSWFQLADRHGFIRNWINATDAKTLNAVARYLSNHQRHASDRVAEILEEKIGPDPDWRDRLRHIVEWSDLALSRRFLDLVLRLIDDGTLDKARGPIAQNSTFWSILHGVAKKRPEWAAEIAGQWLRRRMLLAENAGEGDGARRSGVFGDDEFASEPISRAAAGAPLVFAQQVTPLLLRLSERAVLDSKNAPPLRDRIWYDMPHGKYRSISMAFLDGCASALSAVAANHPTLARSHITTLIGSRSYTANFLLLRLYTGGATHLADEAVDTLCAQPWRLECGRAGARHEISEALIAQIAPNCTPSNRERLESLLLGYVPPAESAAEGRSVRGLASYELLSGIPPTLVTAQGRGRIAELERKFGQKVKSPVLEEAGFVRSPIPADAASHMTDDQWLRAFARYSTDTRPHQRTDMFKGGASQLGEVLQSRAATEPDRFGRLLKRLSDDTNPTYVSRILMALKAETVPADVKAEAVREAYRRWRTPCGAETADLIGSINELLPDDLIEALTWLAEKHPDSGLSSSSHESSLFTIGMGSVRGRAVLAVQSALNQANDPRLTSICARLVNDESAAVRACVASALVALARYDLARAIHLLLTLVGTDDRLLEVDNVQRLMNYGLRDHFGELRGVIERILRSSVDALANAGARLASLAGLSHDDAKTLIGEALNGNDMQRLGVAQVASANVSIEECRSWCVEQLRKAFFDPALEVRREAASCFRQLGTGPLESFEELIQYFCDSPAFADDSASLIHMLDHTKSLLPGTACIVAEKFLGRFASEARDITRGRMADAYTLVPLVFRVYHQHQRDPWGKRSLDVIDQICVEGLQEIDTEFDKYER